MHGNRLIKSLPAECCRVPCQPDIVNELLRTRRNREEIKAEWIACLYPGSPSFTLVQLLQFTNGWNAVGPYADKTVLVLSAGFIAEESQ